MEKMIKLNKSKIAALVEKSGKKISEIAGTACLAYTTAKHIIQEGKDCVEATTVDKAEKLAIALGVTSKAITIGKPYERYPKKASPAKNATKSPKNVVVKTSEVKPKKEASAKTKKCGTATVKNAPLYEIPEAKLFDQAKAVGTLDFLMKEVTKLNTRVGQLEKIVLKNSSRKKLVKVD